MILSEIAKEYKACMARSYGTGKWEKNGYARFQSTLYELRRMGKK
jgi:hypothetical protein